MTTFHRRLGEGRLDEIYEESDSALRAGRSKADLLSAMRDTRETFGAFVRSDIRAASCFPQQVRFVTHTEYEKGQATEMFVWSVLEGKARLFQYQITAGLADVPVGAGNDCKSAK